MNIASLYFVDTFVVDVIDFLNLNPYSLKKVTDFYVLIHRSLHFSEAELEYSLKLLKKFIVLNPSVSTRENMGTLMLISLLLSNKMNRDHPVSNLYWTYLVSISLESLNESELVFLKRINFALPLCLDTETF